MERICDRSNVPSFRHYIRLGRVTFKFREAFVWFQTEIICTQFRALSMDVIGKKFIKLLQHIFRLSVQNELQNAKVPLNCIYPAPQQNFNYMW